MSKKLDGKIALITGGSRGIGAAIAKRLAADGANVAITYTKGADAAASVIKEIEGVGRKAIAIQVDAPDAEVGHGDTLGQVLVGEAADDLAAKGVVAEEDVADSRNEHLLGHASTSGRASTSSGEK